MIVSLTFESPNKTLQIEKSTIESDDLIVIIKSDGDKEPLKLWLTSEEFNQLMLFSKLLT